ncbi:MAG TPA: VOC family protein [Candidatus Mediterraneibacter merdipullorum]|nr:VOC family protein [Candidatus Mediterraneibacter merdipullorum]
MITGVVHSGISVRNLEESINFYHNILGLELLKKEPVRKSRGDKLGVPGAEIQLAVIGIPGTAETFELIQYLKPSSLFGYGVPVNTLGCVHIALRVDDIAGTITDLKSKGIQFCSDTFEEIKDGPIAGMKWIYFKDPDGTNLELIEEPAEYPDS